MADRELNYVNAAALPPQASESKKKEKPRLNVPNLLVGLLVVALAAFGAYRLAQLGVGYFRERSRDLQTIEAGEYYAYLIPAAAVDIESFEDLSSAKMSELVEMSVWGVLNSGLDSTQYQYTADALLLPEAQVAAAFVHYFGTERAIEHTTVAGYGYEFTYDAAAHVYKIPLTTITPAYVPHITETETRGDATVFTVGYLNTGLYSLNHLTGELTAPEPDKYVKITVRTASTGAYISAVRSLGVPEAAAAAPETSAAETSGASDAAESTSENASQAENGSENGEQAENGSENGEPAAEGESAEDEEN